MTSSTEIIAEMDRCVAPAHDGLSIVFQKGEGVWVWDAEGKKYLDALGGYGALSCGHKNASVIHALKEELDRGVGVIGKGAHNAQVSELAKELTHAFGYDKVVIGNSGAEAVKIALKLARRWGLKVKGVAKEDARIIMCHNNYHGASLQGVYAYTTDDKLYEKTHCTRQRDLVPFNDVGALEAAITPQTIAFLLEPVQGKGGVIVPSDDYLRKVRELCTRHNVLMIADEVQTGLGRLGTLASCPADARPDLLVLGKALGGGIYPVSAVLGDRKVMDLLDSMDRVSVCAGNPLAAAVARAALRVVMEEKLAENAKREGEYICAELRKKKLRGVKDIRGKGLLIGIECEGDTRDICKALAKEGIFTMTHSQVLRITPPLTISRSESDFLIKGIEKVLGE